MLPALHLNISVLTALQAKRRYSSDLSYCCRVQINQVNATINAINDWNLYSRLIEDISSSFLLFMLMWKVGRSRQCSQDCWIHSTLDLWKLFVKPPVRQRPSAKNMFSTSPFIHNSLICHFGRFCGGFLSRIVIEYLHNWICWSKGPWKT